MSEIDEQTSPTGIYIVPSILPTILTDVFSMCQLHILLFHHCIAVSYTHLDVYKRQDGMENASRRYDSEKVKKMIERQKEKYGWEFLFLGANIDAVETAKHFGIGADRAVNYHSDREGTQLNYEVLSEAVSAVRCSVPLGTNWKKRIDEDYNSRKDGRK